MTPTTVLAEVSPLGAFDLAQTMDFGFGQREAHTADQVMRLGFVADELLHPVGVAVTQQPDGRLSYQVSAPPGTDLDAVVAQPSRILSVDIDATGWYQLGRRDALLGRLQAARPGL